MSKRMIIMSQDMTRMIGMGDGSHTWTITRTRHNSGEEITIDCDRTWMGTYPTMTEAKSVMGAIMQVYAHEGGIFYMPKASDEEEEEPEPKEKNPWRPIDVELPCNAERCLVTTKTKAVAVAWYDGLHNVWYMFGVTRFMILDGVIAWKKLEVEPYKKPEEND